VSPAPRLADLAMSMAATVSPTPIAPSPESFETANLRGACRTLLPTRVAPATEQPSTQRSATVHPRFEMAARIEAKNLVAVMRLNVDFLGSLLGPELPSGAREALREIHVTIDRLERRFGSARTR
jgi:hypothetical protein